MPMQWGYRILYPPTPVKTDERTQIPYPLTPVTTDKRNNHDKPDKREERDEAKERRKKNNQHNAIINRNASLTPCSKTSVLLHELQKVVLVVDDLGFLVNGVLQCHLLLVETLKGAAAVAPEQSLALLDLPIETPLH